MLCCKHPSNLPRTIGWQLLHYELLVKTTLSRPFTVTPHFGGELECNSSLISKAKTCRNEWLHFESRILISVRLGIKSLTPWKKGHRETQHLIAATTIDVSFHWQHPFREGAMAQGRVLLAEKWFSELLTSSLLKHAKLLFCWWGAKHFISCFIYSLLSLNLAELVINVAAERAVTTCWNSFWDPTIPGALRRGL